MVVSNNGRYRVGVVGTGFFAQFHVEAWARSARADVVAMCDFDPDRLAATAAKLDPRPQTFATTEAMLAAFPDLDIIDMVLREDARADLIPLAGQAGVPVIISQKPLAATHAAAKDLVDAAAKLPSQLIVHENFRFQPWYREAKRLLDAGTLGAPIAGTFRMRAGDGRGPDAYLARQPYFQTMPRFLIHEAGVHYIDVVRFLMGEITGVFAQLSRRNPVIAGEDTALVMFQLAANATALYDGNRLLDHQTDHLRRTNGDMELECEDATLRLDGYGRLWLRKFGSADEHEHAYDWTDTDPCGDSVFAFQEHVINHLDNNSQLETAAADYLRTLVIEDAIYRSAETGQLVSTDP